MNDYKKTKREAVNDYASKLATNARKARGLSIGEKIWKAYKLKCETSYKCRNGYIELKATEPLPFHDAYKKPEMIAEHEGRAAFLYGMYKLYYGNVFGQEQTVEQEKADHVADILRMIFMLCHDVGEIKHGDIPDDGTEAHEVYRADEAEVMHELFSYFPEDLQGLLRSWYPCFEDYAGGKEIMLMKAIDKAEAVAFLAFVGLTYI